MTVIDRKTDSEHHLRGDPDLVRRLIRGELPDPHRLLGAHPASLDGVQGVVIRAYHPDAELAEVVHATGRTTRLQRTDATGLFVAFVPGGVAGEAYRVRFTFPDGHRLERDDPYRHLPSLGDTDLHLFNEGNHRRVWEKLGAHHRVIDGVEGVSFAVWAPNARRVSVVGNFNRWDGRLLPMRVLGGSGVFELFVPGLEEDVLYKYEIRTREGGIRIKADPYAQCCEAPPRTASRVYVSRYQWGDREWMSNRPRRDVTRQPINVYEVHLGSWARVPEEGCRSLTYREIAPRLVEHVKRFGFNYIELMPIAEHPFEGSWGYQVTGYYAPTARYGDPDDVRYLVDLCHRHGIGVILDIVPAHFVKDDFALRMFDGTYLYEHEDPRRGEHPDWGTHIFNYGRHEVRNFLIGNALFWLQEFHIDGLRLDAVASMLYLDYSRRHGEWLPNQHGGNENIEAIEFLRAMNHIVKEECPGCFTVAEESTAWGGVTRPIEAGGLGFAFKWNMGWMHDTLVYFSKDPVHRKYHHDQLTFAMIYEHSERFVMPLSHDEVVHGKQALLEKMPGDLWQKFANLRLLLTYQYTRPGKKLLFMGTELAPYEEWRYDTSLPWHLEGEERRVGLQNFMRALGRLYLKTRCLWRSDPDPWTCSWIDCSDHENSVVSYYRRDEDRLAVIVLNMTPVPRRDYRVGAPEPGRYELALSSDALEFGGSGYAVPDGVDSNPIGMHGCPESINLALPPLAGVVYLHGGGKPEQ
ncbi:MAG: 1,4-alpha-glucan branching protein GlgB [Phycisphaerales bacterium]|nr:MAG: 1,4-alpha-glucan branching protein GlgB [Phycisphaerales bacterium]